MVIMGMGKASWEQYGKRGLEECEILSLRRDHGRRKDNLQGGHVAGMGMNPRWGCPPAGSKVQVCVRGAGTERQPQRGKAGRQSWCGSVGTPNAPENRRMVVAGGGLAEWYVMGPNGKGVGGAK